jgi:hypothetical protein
MVIIRGGAVLSYLAIFSHCAALAARPEAIVLCCDRDYRIRNRMEICAF